MSVLYIMWFLERQCSYYLWTMQLLQLNSFEDEPLISVGLFT